MSTETTPSADRIVVGVDGSASSKIALRWAAYLAATMGADVEAVTAWPASTPAWAAGWSAVPENWDPAADAATTVRNAVTEVFGDAAPVRIIAVVREGPAPKVLLERSEQARMLVVGSRGHGAVAGMLLGSVSAACAEHGRAPVLVVHGLTPPPPIPVAGATRAAAIG